MICWLALPTKISKNRTLKKNTFVKKPHLDIELPNYILDFQQMCVHNFTYLKTHSWRYFLPINVFSISILFKVIYNLVDEMKYLWHEKLKIDTAFWARRLELNEEFWLHICMFLCLDLWFFIIIINSEMWKKCNWYFYLLRNEKACIIVIHI